jgi:hypothetical protein
MANDVDREIMMQKRADALEGLKEKCSQSGSKNAIVATNIDRSFKGLPQVR